MIDMDTYKAIVKAGAVVPRPAYVKGGFTVQFFLFGRVVQSDKAILGSMNMSLSEWYACCHHLFNDVFKTLSAHERMSLMATAARQKNARPTEVTDSP